MNIVQQLLNSNFKPGGSSGFEVSSSSLRFSYSSKTTRTSFSDTLRDKLNSGSKFSFDREQTQSLRVDKSDNQASNRNQMFRQQRDERNGFSRSEQSLARNNPRSEFTASSENRSPDTNRVTQRSSAQNKFDDTADAAETINRRSKQNRSKDNSLTKDQQELLKRVERGEVDLSDPEEAGKVKDLLESIEKDKTSAAAKRDALKALQELFSNPKELLQKLKGASEKDIGKFVDNLKSVLKSFQKIAGQSKNNLKENLAKQVEQLLKELNLSSGSGSSGTQQASVFSFQLSYQETTVSTESKGQTTPTKALKETLGNVINKLEQLSKKVGSKTQGNQFLSPKEAIQKVQNLLKTVKNSLSGSSNSSQGGESSGFLSRQMNQVLSELDQQIKDDELRKKIRNKLKTAKNGTESSGEKTKDTKSANQQKNPNGQKQTTAQNSKATTENASSKAAKAEAAGETKNSKATTKSTPETALQSSKASSKSSNATQSVNGNASQSQNSSSLSAAAEAVKNKAGKNKAGKNGSQAATDSQAGKQKPTSEAKVKTKAVKNQPTNKKSVKTDFKNAAQTNQQKANQASQNQDVIIDTGDAKPDKKGQNRVTKSTKAEKLASFETNTARAVDSTEQSGTSFSNSGNKNGNSNNFSTTVRSQMSSYSQRSAEAQRMINQIVERAQTMLKDGKQSMRLQLQPESLGQVKMEVSIEANKVSARFKVENKSVHKTLTSSIDQLKQSLQEMGLDIDSVDISDMSAENSENEENWFNEPEGNSNNGRGRGGDEQEEGEPAEAPARTRPRKLREYSTIELVA